MADNVQGFNHLDSILINLGQQFRQDAIKRMMLQNQAEHYKNMGSGQYTNKPFAFLQREAMRLTGVHKAFIDQQVNSSKDATGVPQITADQAEQMWQQTPEAGEMQELNQAVMKGLTQMNPTLIKNPSSNPAPTKVPTDFNLGGGILGNVGLGGQ